MGKYNLPVIILIVLCSTSYGQSVSTAVPFVLSSPCAEFSGMGEATVALPTDNGFALLWNPAHLGIQSFYNYGGIGFAATKFYPHYSDGNLPYKTSVYTAGFNLSNYYKLPFEFSLGIAYSRISFDLGRTLIFSVDPTTPIGAFQSKETSEQYTMGAGIEYFCIQTSIGVTTKSIQSDLVPYNLEGGGRRGVSSVHATDWGIVMVVPVADVLYSLGSKRISILNSLSPFIIASFGFAKNNIGDRVAYINYAQADPLPRIAREGIGIDIGLSYTMNETIWKPLSFRWTTEASDLLVRRWGYEYDTTGGNFQVTREPGWEYVDGTGNINFFQNVLLGRANGMIEKRKGWEINLCEIFQYRGGKLEDQLGDRVYRTNGFGVQLRGIFKLIDYSTKQSIEQPVIRWIFDHVDMRYNHSANSGDNPADRDRTYNDYLLVIQN